MKRGSVVGVERWAWPRWVGDARRRVRAALLIALALCAGYAGAQTAGDATGGGADTGSSSGGSSSNWKCHGQFPNPIADICWSCLFPISIGSIEIFENGQDDIENPASPICICPAPYPKYYRIGIEVGFWEPARMVDVTRVPFCMVALGGEQFDVGHAAPHGSQFAHDFEGMHSNYQVHWYLNPILYWLELEINDQCHESGSYDLVYITEVDALWQDDESAAVLAPENSLFATPVAVAACAADCIAASAGFGIASMFWCGGCNGQTYPLSAHVGTHIGAVQASELLVHRMAAKMHRLFISWTYAGDWAVCGPYPQPVMDKRQYKTDLVYPIPRSRDASLDNQCCSPFGRSTIFWNAGKEYPIAGEDFAYQLFRKRNCCMSD